jgi:molybdopterin molybdotransferase
MSLLSYEGALQRVRNGIQPLSRVERVDLRGAIGRILAQEIVGTVDHPPFDNSGVDGYAVAESPRLNHPIPVLGQIVAGGPSMWLSGGCALRVLTGGALPPNTYAVVMQEDVEPVIGRIRVKAGVRKDENIRRQGDDFRRGDLLLKPGQLLNSGAIALLASQGILEPEVFELPSVGILTTGDELVSIETEPAASQLRDSNQELLAAALAKVGVTKIVRRRVRDDGPATEEALTELATDTDLIVASGGASVGDFDFLRSSLEKIGEIDFHGISVRPGKPTMFGRVGNTPVFGLPGNPSSTFVCFQLFVAEAIRRLASRSSPESIWVPARFRGKISPTQRDHFERVLIVSLGGELFADGLHGENSQGLKACAVCNGLARIPGALSMAEPVVEPIVQVLLID